MGDAIETPGRWAHVTTVDYFSSSCEPPNKASMSTWLRGAVFIRDQAVRTDERAKCVAELRAHAEQLGEDLGKVEEYHAVMCAADLLESKGEVSDG